MKVLQYFQCDYCHKIYETEDKCTICESNHKIGYSIVQAEYDPILENKDGYPSSLMIKFENDNTNRYVEYQLCKFVNHYQPEPEPEPEEPTPDETEPVPEEPETQEPEHSDDDDVVIEEDDEENITNS